MTLCIIDGKKVSEEIEARMSAEVGIMKKEQGRVPGLAVILVGDNPASSVYVSMKKKACMRVGFYAEDFILSSSASQHTVISLIERLNHDDRIDGILVQLPLPKHINSDVIIETIAPSKDVDGFHPYNLGRLLMGKPQFIPCTPFGIYELLKYYSIDPAGKHVVVMGRSTIVGKPIAVMLGQREKGANATVTVCHTGTKNIAQYTRTADIIIVAVGTAHALTKDMVKDGVVVIDVGINRIEDPSVAKGYRIIGDVAYEEVAQRAAAITPVPGGVGPMTIAMLLSNTLLAARKRMV